MPRRNYAAVVRDPQTALVWTSAPDAAGERDAILDWAELGEARILTWYTGPRELTPALYRLARGPAESLVTATPEALGDVAKLAAAFCRYRGFKLFAADGRPFPALQTPEDGYEARCYEERVLKGAHGMGNRRPYPRPDPDKIAAARYAILLRQRGFSYPTIEDTLARSGYGKWGLNNLFKLAVKLGIEP